MSDALTDRRVGAGNAWAEPVRRVMDDNEKRRARRASTVIIMDIDGTLADASHRIHMLPKAGVPENPDAAWLAFFEACDDDTLIEEIAALNNGLFPLHQIFMVTGRNEDHRARTVAWLDRHKLRYDRLLMRPSADRRPDTVLKKEVLTGIRAQGLKVMFAVEDRASVTKMWRENGVRCLQVCEGDY